MKKKKEKEESEGEEEDTATATTLGASAAMSEVLNGNDWKPSWTSFKAQVPKSYTRPFEGWGLMHFVQDTTLSKNSLCPPEAYSTMGIELYT